MHASHRLMRHRRHASARLGATPTCIRTLRHQLVASAHGPAGCLARPADLGTGRARVHAVIRAAEHEVRRRLTDFRAVEQQPDVMRLGVLAAEVEAVVRRLEADGVAAGAFVEALLHLARRVVGSSMGHGASPFRAVDRVSAAVCRRFHAISFTVDQIAALGGRWRCRWRCTREISADRLGLRSRQASWRFGVLVFSYFD